MEVTGGGFIPQHSKKGEQNEEHREEEKNKRLHAIKNHTDHDFDLRLRVSRPVEVLCDKKMISQHHTPPHPRRPSVHLLSCSSPDGLTPRLSLHTTIATSLFPFLGPATSLTPPSSPSLGFGDKAS